MKIEKNVDKKRLNKNGKKIENKRIVMQICLQWQNPSYIDEILEMLKIDGKQFTNLIYNWYTTHPQCEFTQYYNINGNKWYEHRK